VTDDARRTTRATESMEQPSSGIREANVAPSKSEYSLFLFTLVATCARPHLHIHIRDGGHVPSCEIEALRGDVAEEFTTSGWHSTSRPGHQRRREPSSPCAIVIDAYPPTYTRAHDVRAVILESPIVLTSGNSSSTRTG